LEKQKIPLKNIQVINSFLTEQNGIKGSISKTLGGQKNLFSGRRG
jgi:hypothetical protein